MFEETMARVFQNWRNMASQVQKTQRIKFKKKKQKPTTCPYTHIYTIHWKTAENQEKILKAARGGGKDTTLKKI